MQACQGLQSWYSQVQEQKWDGSVVMAQMLGWRQTGVRDLADFPSLHVCPVSDRLFGIWQSRTLSPKLSTPRGTHAFRVLLNCVRTVWMNRFIPAKNQRKSRLSKDLVPPGPCCLWLKLLYDLYFRCNTSSYTRPFWSIICMGIQNWKWLLWKPTCKKFITRSQELATMD